MKKLARLAVLAVATLSLLFGAMATSAHAQDDYPNLPPAGPLDGLTDAQIIEVITLLNSPSGTAITSAVAQGGEIEITLSFGSLIVNASLIDRVLVEFNPTVYDGPVPASGSLSFSVPACDSTVTVTYFLKTGQKLSEKLAVAGSGSCASPAVAVPAAQLAFTGGEVSLPVAAGAILIGSGGLMLLAANKRSRKDV
ncbi:MAG: hypothetical protein AAF567_12260 [Actinomycetota bacterium]